MALPEIAVLRPRLLAEFPVCSLAAQSSERVITTGVLDAVALGIDGEPEVVVDWKTDVAPHPEVVEAYKAQVRSYLRMLGLTTGMIVFITTGQVLRVKVEPSAP